MDSNDFLNTPTSSHRNNFSWNKHEEWVRDNINKLTPEQMAEQLGVRFYDIDQFIRRKKLFSVKTEPKNLAYEIIKLKFIFPEYFKPTRRFFKAIGMSQRQWWSAYRGDVPLTEQQYFKLSVHLNVTLPEAFELRQISLTFSENKEVEK